jgi:glycosyltransferase involved in cell wall biosynthesis
MASQKTTLVHITTVPQSLWFFTGQITFMKAHGFSVTCLSSPGPKLGQFSKLEDVPVHAVAMPRRISPLRDLSALARLCRTVRRIQPQIVHAHTPKGGLLGMISSWLVGVPVRIYHIHGLPFVTQQGWKRQLLIWAERTSCLMATQVLCVSHSVRELAVTERLCPPAKIKVLLGGSINGVDSHGRFNPMTVPTDGVAEARQRLGLPRNAVVMGFIGRLVRDKGIHELSEAWKTLRQRHPDLHLIIAGEPEEQDPVDPRVTEILQTDPRVHMIGPVDEPEYVYALLDLFVLPSYREGLSTVLLEAASMALPSVTTRVPGCLDVVMDGVTGTVVSSHDGHALAEAVSRYVIDADLRQNHGRVAREMVLSRFDQHDVWVATRQEYERLLRDRGILPVDTGQAMAKGGR